MDEKKPKRSNRRPSIYANQAQEEVELPKKKIPSPPTAYESCYPEMLIEHMAQGRSFYSFGALIGRSKSTLDNWVEKYPEFAEAKEIGQLKALQYWESLGIEGIHQGKSFNAQVWMFAMRARFRKEGYRDKFPEDEGHSPHTVNNTINISGPELVELIKNVRGEVHGIEAAVDDRSGLGENSRLLEPSVSQREVGATPGAPSTEESP